MYFPFIRDNSPCRFPRLPPTPPPPPPMFQHFNLYDLSVQIQPLHVFSWVPWGNVILCPHLVKATNLQNVGGWQIIRTHDEWAGLQWSTWRRPRNGLSWIIANEGIVCTNDHQRNTGPAQVSCTGQSIFTGIARLVIIQYLIMSSLYRRTWIRFKWFLAFWRFIAYILKSFLGNGCRSN